MDPDDIRDATRRLAPIAVLYDFRLRECGPTARGVYWRNEDGQRLRFEVLIGVIDVKDEADRKSVV